MKTLRSASALLLISTALLSCLETPFANPPQQAPTLLTPDQDATVGLSNLTLTWTEVDGATGYSLILNDRSPIDLSETQYQVPSDFADVDVQWRVRPYNESGHGPAASGDFVILRGTDDTNDSQVCSDDRQSISWDPVDGAGRYKLQIAAVGTEWSEATGFATVQEEHIVSQTSWYPASIAAGSNLIWSVSAEIFYLNEGYFGEWSVPDTLEVHPLIDTPVLTPISDDCSPSEPSFSWATETGLRYQFEYVKGSDFTIPAMSADLGPDDVPFNHEIVVPGGESWTLSWRVRAYDPATGCHSLWSAADSMNVLGQQSMHLTESTDCDDREIDLSWNAVGAANYEVHVSATADFTPDGTTLVDTVAGTTYTLTQFQGMDLPRLTPLYVRVVATAGLCTISSAERAVTLWVPENLSWVTQPIDADEWSLISVAWTGAAGLEYDLEMDSDPAVGAETWGTDLDLDAATDTSWSWFLTEPGAFRMRVRGFDPVLNCRTDWLESDEFVLNDVCDPGEGRSGIYVSSAEDTLITGIDVDAAGNRYVTGTWSDLSVDLSPAETVWDFNFTTDEYKTFIAKYDINGNVLWWRTLISDETYNYDGGDLYYGGGSDMQVESMDLDYANGYVVVGGRFAGNVNFDADGGGVVTADVTIPGQGDTAGFVLLLNEDGDFQWVRTIGSDLNDANAQVSSVQLDDTASKVYAAGWLIDGNGNYVDFNLTGTGTVTRTTFEARDGFAMVMNRAASTPFTATAADVLFAELIGTDGTGMNDQAAAILPLAGGDFLVTGHGENTMSFPHTSLTVQETMNDKGVYLARITESGDTQWVAKIDGDDDDRASSMDINAAGDILLGGYFQSETMDVFHSSGADAGFDVTEGSANAGDYNGFVAKFNSAGTAQWTHSFGMDTNFDLVMDVVWDGSTPVVGGTYTATADFGPGFMNVAGFGATDSMLYGLFDRGTSAEMA